MQKILIAVTVLMAAVGCNTMGQSEQADMTAIHETIYSGKEQLSPCPNKNNCVCSEDPRETYSVFPLRFQGDSENAWRSLEQVIINTGGTVVQRGESFIHATFHSAVFRFVDDVTCRLDSEHNLIHIRSASRTGFSDFGVNRKRVDKIRQLFNASF